MWLPRCDIASHDKVPRRKKRFGVDDQSSDGKSRLGQLRELMSVIMSIHCVAIQAQQHSGSGLPAHYFVICAKGWQRHCFIRSGEGAELSWSTPTYRNGTS